VIQYVTIASTGNSTDFGDLISASYSLSACANATRGVFIGGGGTEASMSYITIASTGNATSFGTLSPGRSQLTACSNAHGGL
jgi:hypothetical protein